MIISASRRTDIPSHYSEWFFNRIKDGYLYVRNPVKLNNISKVSLSPDVVDGIVFWTKNPTPMLNRLDEIDKYNYYFQFTLNSYGNDVEPNVPSKNDSVVPAFQELSNRIGKERIVWRYDPIFINKKYTVDYHIKYFNLLADKLSDYTEKCTVSFIDMYSSVVRNTSAFNIKAPTQSQIEDIMGSFSEIAKEHGIYIDTCAEAIDLEKYGIRHASCIDKERLERIGNYKLNTDKDKNQRSACGCVASIDIGSYSTCKNGCVYCYANSNKTDVKFNSNMHNPNSPLLFGEVTERDSIIERKMKSLVG